ncbi:unnamed protein product, partial [Symbiodinium sp. KB8]
MVDVSDVSVAYDRIFNFVAFRHHLIHFYLPCPELRHEGEQQDPPMLQQAVEGQRQFDREVDRLGHHILKELRVTFRQMSSRAGIFKYCVYTMFVQHPKIFVPVSYVSPAMPHLTVYASVCKEWNRSISTVVQYHNMLDFRRLWMFHADLIPDLRLLIIRLIFASFLQQQFLSSDSGPVGPNTCINNGTSTASDSSKTPFRAKQAKPAKPNSQSASTERQTNPATNRGQASTEHQTNPSPFTLLSVAPAPAVPKATLTGAESQSAKNVDEQFLKDLLSADVHDISSQLEIQLEGRTAVDHIPKGLSTLSQFLLYREQLLENPYPEQWVMAPWQALRTNADRASLIRKSQRPFASLKDPERDRCAKYLLSLFSEPVPPNTIGRAEFFGFIDCILQSRLNYEREGATGILATGKVLPTDHAVAGLDPEEEELPDGSDAE